MRIEELKLISDIINQRKDKLWYSLKKDINDVYKNDTLENLINQFEKDILSLKIDNLPNLTFIFFVSLIIVFPDNKKEIENILKRYNEIMKYLKISLEMFLKGKYDNFKYEGYFYLDSFKNKYELVSRFDVNFLGTEFSVISSIFELVYYIDRKYFLELISKDTQYIVFCNFLINNFFEFEYYELLKQLESEDEVISNAALYFIMSSFNRYVREIEIKKRYDPENTIKISEDNLSNEIDKLKNIFNKINLDKQIYLVTNYIFGNVELPKNFINIYPDFFNEIIKNVNIESLMSNLKRQELKNMYILVKIWGIINNIDYIEVKELVIENLIEWIEKSPNTLIWANVKDIFKNIINGFEYKIKKEIKNEIQKILSKIFVTTFDQEIRHKMYLTDNMKEIICKDVLYFINLE